jgi:hypothetical protein
LNAITEIQILLHDPMKDLLKIGLSEARRSPKSEHTLDLHPSEQPQDRMRGEPSQAALTADMGTNPHFWNEE